MVRKPAAVVISLALVLGDARVASWAQEDPNFPRVLKEAARTSPDEPARGLEPPPDFAAFLAARQVTPRDGGWVEGGAAAPVTFKRLNSLYELHLVLAPPLGAAAPSPAFGSPWERELERARRRVDDYRDLLGSPVPENWYGRSIFDHEPEPVPLFSVPVESFFERRKKDPDRRGLSIQGIEIGGGADVDPEEEAPYLRRGMDRVLDWDLQLKLREDSLGFRARYRHPDFLEQLSGSFKYYMDVPGELGLGDGRDKVYGWFGKEPKGRKEGFDAGLSGVFNQYWGVGLGYSDKRTVREDSESWSRGESVSLGYTPLGRNEGKFWNFSLFAGVNHQEVETRGAERDERKSGFGYSTGIAFSHALGWVPIPGLNPKGGESNGYAWLKQFTASLSLSDSQIGDLSARAAAGLSAQLTKHLRLSAELGYTWNIEENEGDFSPRFGVSLRY